MRLSDYNYAVNVLREAETARKIQRTRELLADPFGSAASSRVRQAL